MDEGGKGWGVLEVRVEPGGVKGVAGGGKMLEGIHGPVGGREENCGEERFGRKGKN